MGAVWNTTYSWNFSVSDSTGNFTLVTPTTFTPVVAQPAYSAAGVDPTALDAQDVNLFTGAYTRSETDVSVPGAGSAVQVTRTYNSTDSRTGVFGTGWSSLLDASWTTTGNWPGHLPYAGWPNACLCPNPNGSWAPGFGQSTSVYLVPGTRKIYLGDVTYGFDQTTGKITSSSTARPAPP